MTRENFCGEPEVPPLCFEHRHLEGLHEKGRQNAIPQGNLDCKLLMC